MTGETKLQQSTLRRFVKDFRLPVHIVAEPYFSHLLDLYERDFRTRSAFANLLAAVEAAGGEQAFLALSKRVFEGAVDELKSLDMSAGGGWMTRPDLDAYLRANGLTPQSKSLDAVNDASLAADHHFISVDMVGANFQIMRLVGVLPEDATWRGFMARHSADPYFLSKGLRQAVFGQLNAKRQNQLQGMVTAEMSRLLMPAFAPLGVTASAICVDELAVAVKESPDSKIEAIMREVMRSLSLASHGINGRVNVRCEAYRLEPLGVANYMARTVTARVEFLGAELVSSASGLAEVDFLNVPRRYHAECFKAFFGIPLDPVLDMTYEEDGRLVRFADPLFAPRSTRGMAS